MRTTTDDPRGWQYLAEWKPVHTAQSATVYAELRRRRPAAEPPDRTLVALGDPSYPPLREDTPHSADKPSDEESGTPIAVRSAKRRGLFDGLKPLPHARREVTEIGRLFPEGAATTYLGADATEERAKTDLAQARHVHFAAHGLADPETPLDSFLALTIPEGLPEDRENGILQAWEIIDHLRLNADLVVLSVLPYEEIESCLLGRLRRQRNHSQQVARCDVRIALYDQSRPYFLVLVAEARIEID